MLPSRPQGAGVVPPSAPALTFLWENYKNKAKWKEINLELIGITQDKTIKTLEKISKYINGKREFAKAITK